MIMLSKDNVDCETGNEHRSPAFDSEALLAQPPSNEDKRHLNVSFWDTW